MRLVHYNLFHTEMESNDGHRNEGDENTKEKQRLCSSFLPHWSYILLTVIIIAISSVVALLLLPYYLQGNDGPSAAVKLRIYSET